MRLKPRRAGKRTVLLGCLVSLAACSAAGGGTAAGQLGTPGSTLPPYVWVNKGNWEGHLSLDSSPAGAFSPHTSTFAVANEDKVVLLNLAQNTIERVVKPQIPGLDNLTIDSANFVAPDELFLLGKGALGKKHKGGMTPLLAFRWNTQQDKLIGKVSTIGAKGDAGPIYYFPRIGYVGIYQSSSFELWEPTTGREQETQIPELTRRPLVFTFSPDGHWLILAQVQGGGTNDPVVVQLSTHQMVNSLRGHQGAVMSVEFSPDSRKVVTACEDGKVRIYSVPDWKLLETLTGHQGPVHWAEFSPDGKLVASAGEDATVRVWSVADGKLLQTLSESQQALRTVAFSPDGQYIAATSEKSVLLWLRTATGD